MFLLHCTVPFSRCTVNAAPNVFVIALYLRREPISITFASSGEAIRFAGHSRECLRQIRKDIS
jgi:hypothetical protein